MHLVMGYKETAGEKFKWHLSRDSKKCGLILTLTIMHNIWCNNKSLYDRCLK